MSLINEALKRARLEAARQDAAGQRMPVSSLPSHVPPRRSAWTGLALGLAAGVLLSLIAFGAVMMALRRPAPPADAPAVATAPPPVGMNETASAMESTAPSTSSAGPAETTPGAPTGTTTPAATAASSPSIPPVSESPSATTPAAAPEPAPPTAPPAETAAIPAPPSAPAPTTVPAATPAAPALRTYVKEAKLPGGEQLKLDFIVWSESQTFAQINGRLIGVGERVEGFTLERIERRQVELQGPSGTRFVITIP